MESFEEAVALAQEHDVNLTAADLREFVQAKLRRKLGQQAYFDGKYELSRQCGELD